MLEISDDIVLKKPQEEEEEDIIREQEEKSVKEIQVIKEVKKVEKNKKNEEVDKKITIMLHGNGLSENFIKTFINASPTDEHVKLLKVLNLNDDDIDILQDLRRTKIRVSKSSDSINSAISTDSSSDGRAYLSPNSDYLKRVLSKPLTRALCEIVTKKPADPVEYLGHWLLHFKVCEERTMQQKERKLKLSINREKFKLKEVENKGLPIEQKQEESSEDWNHSNYGEL